MNHEKPIIPNNYIINSNIQVLYRTHNDDKIEIYKTNSDNYLFLIKVNINIQDSIKQKYNIQQFFIGQKQYLMFLSKQNYQDKLTELYKNLITLSGFEAVAGMRNLKSLLKQDVILPILKKEKYKKFKITIPNGILLYGPPGCGKTFIVRKLAEELNFSYFEIKHSDITTPYIHGGVEKIAEIFKLAKTKAPSIIFIDELEGLVPERSNLDSNQSYKIEEVNEFLSHLNDAGKSGILVIGATNQPNLIDKAILRSGRIDKKIYVMPPDFEARIHLFRMYLSNRPIQNIDYEVLAGQTVGYSCSDIEYICSEAARVTVANENDYITQDTLMKILKLTTSSIL